MQSAGPTVLDRISQKKCVCKNALVVARYILPAYGSRSRKQEGSSAVENVFQNGRVVARYISKRARCSSLYFAGILHRPSKTNYKRDWWLTPVIMETHEKCPKKAQLHAKKNVFSKVSPLVQVRHLKHSKMI
jgi:hypothetical protein